MTGETIKRLGLGKNVKSLGLKELLSDINSEQNNFARTNDQTIAIENLRPGKYQPRKTFDSTALEELAESIKKQGLIQPIIVRAIDEDKYEIIAGERRWRASQLAGLREVPVIIRKIDDADALAIALIENIQRENLNAIDQAKALEQLVSEFTMTHQEIAAMVGKSRATITNLLRLLNLNPNVQSLIENQTIEMGHARALLALENDEQIEIANTVVAKGLSVRETERLVANSHRFKSSPSAQNKYVNPDIKKLALSLESYLNTKVEIQQNSDQKGKVIIQFKNQLELDDIAAIILKK